MVNLNKINKDYEEILSGLSFEEIVTYYRNVNKKMLETYPTLNSNKWNIEEHNKLFNSVEEATDIFKKQYPLINIVKYATKLEELENKYLEEHDLAVYKLLAYALVNLSNSISHIVHDILMDLTHIYLYYDSITFANMGMYTLKEEVNVPEELLEPLEPYFYNMKNHNSFYGAKALSFLNDNIQVNFEVLELYIKDFNKKCRINFNAEEVPEDLVEVLEIYNNAYDSGAKAINHFEELKKNPFKTAIEITVESMKKIEEKSEFIKHDYDKILESKLAEAPKYNFTTFEIELPTGVVN